MEHRWGSRREISHAVRVRTKSGAIAHGTLLNISVSGALLSTDAPLRVSGNIEVQMFARSKVVRPFTAAAAHVVRRCSQPAPRARIAAHRPISYTVRFRWLVLRYGTTREAFR